MRTRFVLGLASNLILIGIIVVGIGLVPWYFNLP